jgi:amidophosphoribosyltransferase
MALRSPHDDTSRVLADDTRVLADDTSRVLADDKFHDECGVFGVWRVPDAAAVTALGLHALQHRGQESTGIVSFDGHHFHSHRGLGLVGDNFSDARVIAALPGPTAIGHNRYATTGATILRNVQPLYADFEFGGFAVAHNGNLTNARAATQRWSAAAAVPVRSDLEVFVQSTRISLIPPWSIA